MGFLKPVISQSFNLLMLIPISLTGCQSPFELIDGDPGAIQDMRRFGIQLDYGDMTVGGFVSEEEFIQAQLAKKGEDGQEWLRKWREDRQYFEPAFADNLDASLQQVGVTAGPGLAGAEAIIVLRTTALDPGVFGFVFEKNAWIDVRAEFVDARSQMPLLVLERLRIPGWSVAFDPTSRGQLITAYELAGDWLGDYLCDEVFDP